MRGPPPPSPVRWHCPQLAHAQDWPTRPVTMVVPFAAGGPVDTMARIMAARLSELLGQQVVVENIGGAGGMTGTAGSPRRSPDGYTMVLSGSAVLAINQTLYKRPLYNAVTDFEHVAMFSDSRARADRAQGPAGRPRLRNSSPTPRPTRQDAVRLRRRRLGHAHLRRAARRGHGHEDHARALSRRRPGDAGSDRRPHRFHRRADLHRAPADPGRHGEGDRHARLDRAPGLEDLATAQELGLSRASTAAAGARSRFRRARRRRSCGASPRRRTTRWRRRPCASGSRASA